MLITKGYEFLWPFNSRPLGLESGLFIFEVKHLFQGNCVLHYSSREITYFNLKIYLRDTWGCIVLVKRSPILSKIPSKQNVYSKVK